MARTKQPMTREFRKRMLQQAAWFFAALVAVMLVLVGTLGEKGFVIAALVLIPVAALTFNLLQRRAYAATSAGKR